MPTALLLWCACARPAPREGTTDRLAYVEAVRLQQADPAAAVAACDAIADPALGGECRTFAAVAAARTGTDSVAWCDNVADAGWRAVCHLEVVDALESVGVEASARCARAGALRERCLSHAVARSVTASAGRWQVGEEDAEVAAIRAAIAEVGLPDVPGYRADLDLELLGASIGARLEQRARAVGGAPPFKTADCGVAPERACAIGYRDYLRRHGGELVRIEALCADGVDQDEVEAAGLPAWDAASETVARRTWGDLCERFAAGPPGTHVPGP